MFVIRVRQKAPVRVHVRIVFVELVQQLVISILQCGRLARGAAHLRWVCLCDNTELSWQNEVQAASQRTQEKKSLDRAVRIAPWIRKQTNLCLLVSVQFPYRT